MSVASAIYDNHTPDLVEAVLPDIRAALARPEHPDADALIERAQMEIDIAFAESGISTEAADWVFKALVGVALLEPTQHDSTTGQNR